VLRTGTHAPAAVIEALFLPGASARAAAEASSANDTFASATASELTAVVRGTSARRPARARCVVPNVRGTKLAAARKAITKARCRVEQVTRSWSGRVGDDKLIRQRPAPRTRLAPRNRVHLVVSKGRWR
jgi:PASTA domain